MRRFKFDKQKRIDLLEYLGEIKPDAIEVWHCDDTEVAVIYFDGENNGLNG